MENISATDLIKKFNSHSISKEEEVLLECMIESGEISLEELHSIDSLQESISEISLPGPSTALDDRFYNMLALQKKEQRSFSWLSFFQFDSIPAKVALASFMLIIGMALGYVIVPSNSSKEDVQALREQVSDLKEMMMLSLLEKESATERLRAVSLTQEMNEASVKVTSALIKTLNEDQNINVRLAALDALKPYVQNSKVREELIRSISRQDSPLVQIALAELMAQIQERASVKELEKIMDAENTPAEVKTKIKESLKVLI